MQVKFFEGKGRGVVSTKPFQRGDFVVEYAGDLVEIDEAKQREAFYSHFENVGCYMYYFQHKNKRYWYVFDNTKSLPEKIFQLSSYYFLFTALMQHRKQIAWVD